MKTYSVYNGKEWIVTSDANVRIEDDLNKWLAKESVNLLMDKSEILERLRVVLSKGGECNERCL